MTAEKTKPCFSFAAPAGPPFRDPPEKRLRKASGISKHRCALKSLHVMCSVFGEGGKMGRDRTRRGFLKASGGGIAALAAAHAFPEFSPATEQAGTSPAPSDLALWVTSENRRFSRAPSISWRPASGPAAGDAVVLDPGRKFQSILGFGAAFTDAACYMFSQLLLPRGSACFMNCSTLRKWG